MIQAGRTESRIPPRKCKAIDAVWKQLSPYAPKPKHCPKAVWPALTGALLGKPYQITIYGIPMTVTHSAVIPVKETTERFSSVKIGKILNMTSV